MSSAVQIEKSTQGLRLAVVGGGSTYTPELIDGVTRNGGRLPIAELVLLDTDPERMEVVGGFARRMLDHDGWPGALTLTTDPVEAIADADFVLLQLRVGGQTARLGDETLPRRFGLVGQETTGAGGFAKALRTVPVVLELADLIRQRASPTAWVIDFTNPVGIITQALLDEGHRAIGLCNVAIGFQRRFADRFGVEPDRVQINQVGLNHLTWIREVLVDGSDRLPQLIEEDAEVLASEVGLDPEQLKSLRAIPSYYLRYYYRESEMVAEAATHPTRAASVIDIESELLDMYRDPSLNRKPALLERRGGAFYSEAAVQLMASLHDGRGDTQVVDIVNRGTLLDLDDDAVVEVPATITRNGASPLPQKPLDPPASALAKRVKNYERLTVRAARTGDREVALEAIRANPLSGSSEQAPDLLEAILDSNRQWLPAFFD